MTGSWVWHDSFICATRMIHVCNMIHKPLAVFLRHVCVCHDSFMCATWLTHVCDMNGSYLRHDSISRRGIVLTGRVSHWSYSCFICVCVTWGIHMRGMTVCVTWGIHMCYMTHSYLLHDSFIFVTWLIHICYMTHSYVLHDSFIFVTWLIHVWLIHICYMTHSYLLHDSFLPHSYVPTWLDLTRFELICVYQD